ncbi:hypothetical protein SDC9_139693 [bioreactor metagenome]|uniref:Uncharacterized protein n=1 Tax=bioreactor metagenome TaxID=1076179 RepID=A0A645DTU5_9ZZZZ
MDGGHQAFLDAEVLMQNLGDGGQAVGGAGGVGHKLHVGGVLLVVDAHDEHRGVVLGGSAHDHVLRARIDVALALFLCQVLPGTLADILRPRVAPGNAAHFLLRVHGNAPPIDNQRPVLMGHLALKPAVNRVIAQHIGHIVRGHERIVHRHNLHIVPGLGDAENQTTNAAEAINSNLNLHKETSPFKFGRLKPIAQPFLLIVYICIVSQFVCLCNCQNRKIFYSYLYKSNNF